MSTLVLKGHPSSIRQYPPHCVPAMKITMNAPVAVVFCYILRLDNLLKKKKISEGQRTRNLMEQENILLGNVSKIFVQR